LDATNFALGLYDPEKEEIRFPFVVTKSDIDRDVITIPASGGLNGFVVQNREPLLLRSPEEVISFHKARGIEMIGETPTCWLGVPLLHGDRVLGTMFVQTYSRPGLYGEHDLDLLTMIASQVAIAIENAHLFEETQRALEEVREVSERQLRLLDTVRELSTPLVPITDDILVLPLIGAIDSQRAQQILETLLMGATERRARVVILDITGVPVVDTGVANHILQATRALRLVGAECILVGITPEVAQTVVGLGLELQDLVTRSDLQGGVDHALRHVGKQIG
jgi:anti-anti-sigma regulatory factor